MRELPRDVVIHVIGFLDAVGLLSLFRTSQSFSTAVISALPRTMAHTNERYAGLYDARQVMAGEYAFLGQLRTRPLQIGVTSSERRRQINTEITALDHELRLTRDLWDECVDIAQATRHIHPITQPLAQLSRRDDYRHPVRPPVVAPPGCEWITTG